MILHKKKKRKWAHDTAHSVGSKSNQCSYQIAVLENRGERRKVKGQKVGLSIVLEMLRNCVFVQLVGEVTVSKWVWCCYNT